MNEWLVGLAVVVAVVGAVVSYDFTWRLIQRFKFTQIMRRFPELLNFLKSNGVELVEGVENLHLEDMLRRSTKRRRTIMVTDGPEDETSTWTIFAVTAEHGVSNLFAYRDRRSDTVIRSDWEEDFTEVGYSVADYLREQLHWNPGRRLPQIMVIVKTLSPAHYSHATPPKCSVLALPPVSTIEKWLNHLRPETVAELQAA